MVMYYVLISVVRHGICLDIDSMEVYVTMYDLRMTYVCVIMYGCT